MLTVAWLVVAGAGLGAGQQCRVVGGPPCQLPYRDQTGQLLSACTKEGRCPTRFSKSGSRNASLEPEDWGQCGADCPLQRYTPPSSIPAALASLAASFPRLARVFTIGVSAGGRQLTGLRISGEGQPRPLLTPMVRVVGQVEGDQAAGPELVLQLARHLLTGYQHDPALRQLLDTTDISLLPSLNPDGLERARQGDCSGGGESSKNAEGGDIARPPSEQSFSAGLNNCKDYYPPLLRRKRGLTGRLQGLSRLDGAPALAGRAGLLPVPGPAPARDPRHDGLERGAVRGVGGPWFRCPPDHHPV